MGATGLASATAGYLRLRHPLPTLIFEFAATLLAMLAALLLEAPLPDLPFIALSFVLANAISLFRSFFERYSTQ